MPIKSAILTLFISAILVIVGIWIGNNVNLLPIDASMNAPVYDELFRVLFSIGTIPIEPILPNEKFWWEISDPCWRPSRVLRTCWRRLPR